MPMDSRSLTGRDHISRSSPLQTSHLLHRARRHRNSQSTRAILLGIEGRFMDSGPAGCLFAAGLPLLHDATGSFHGRNDAAQHDEQQLHEEEVERSIPVRFLSNSAELRCRLLRQPSMTSAEKMPSPLSSPLIKAWSIPVQTSKRNLVPVCLSRLVRDDGVAE